MTEQHPDHDSTNVGGAVLTPTQMLRDQLSAFRFNEELTPSLRRSPRNHGRFVKFEEEDSSLPALAPDSVPPASKKRARSELTPVVDEAPSRALSPKKQRSESVPAKKRKEKPSVAPPEKYAHLDALSDHLGEGPDMLNVMFCGINPGQMSATLGHHFAHPTNHFWKCLHASQLTDRLLNPREDHTLPADYSIGLTNLVSRPSASAAELANTEFTAGVPTLLRKIVERRPQIVCFVGKAIWESFIRAVAPPSKSAVKAEVVDAEFTMNIPTSSTASSSACTPGSASSSSPATRAPSRAKVKRTNSKKLKPEPFVYDLQPYKVIHTAPDATVRETLFSVVVSTSGLVAGYQLPEKAKQFTALKKRVDELKNGTLDTSFMTILSTPPTHLN
ncbi:uracil-DNA glycosylase-like protein [Ganoderma leucocontextum]|nr:uracil-DNA glycosylase-like protein [Ganoderma leucocontextum]